MRILLLHNAVYFPSVGGSNKGNRLLLEALAQRGHDCRVVARSTTARERTDLAMLLAQRGVVFENAGGVIEFVLNGVDIHAVLSADHLTAATIRSIESFRPDWIFVSSEDFGHHLLRTALALRPDRVVLIVHTTHDLPVGPSSFRPNQRGQELLGRVRAIMVASKFVQEYVKTHAQRDSEIVRFPFWKSAICPVFASFDHGCVGMINPCAVKGVSIFADVARAFPNVPFAAVAGWGTTDADRSYLRTLPNIKMIEASQNVEEVYSQMKIMLVPSLWDEAFGVVAIESMLYGIPVVASNSGGLPESKLGVEYCLPVRRIVKYERRFDERMLPVALIPPQDSAPWIDAVGALLHDRAVYESVSDRSLRASRRYVATAGAEGVERVLASI